MNEKEFVDYYELLQLSPNADIDTIEKMFRHQAKKYHPDSTENPDNEIFQKVVEAHRILADPEIRAGYDVKYQDYWNRKWRIASEASDKSAFADDRLTRDSLLSLLYVQRRRNAKSPGLGELEISRLLHTPSELIEFHLWYLRNKGWVERLESGLLAITVLGVDAVEQSQLRLMPDHLLEHHYRSNEDSNKREEGLGDLLATGENLPPE